MKIISTTLAAIAGFTVCLSSALAADDAFVGKWKMNPAKSQLGGQQYKVEEAGEGKYRFVYGSLWKPNSHGDAARKAPAI